LDNKVFNYPILVNLWPISYTSLSVTAMFQSHMKQQLKLYICLF